MWKFKTHFSNVSCCSRSKSPKPRCGAASLLRPGTTPEATSTPTPRETTRVNIINSIFISYCTPQAKTQYRIRPGSSLCSTAESQALCDVQHTRTVLDFWHYATTTTLTFKCFNCTILTTAAKISKRKRTTSKLINTDQVSLPGRRPLIAAAGYDLAPTMSSSSRAESSFRLYPGYKPQSNQSPCLTGTCTLYCSYIPHVFSVRRPVLNVRSQYPWPHSPNGSIAASVRHLKERDGLVSIPSKDAASRGAATCISLKVLSRPNQQPYSIAIPAQDQSEYRISCCFKFTNRAIPRNFHMANARHLSFTATRLLSSSPKHALLVLDG